MCHNMKSFFPPVVKKLSCSSYQNVSISVFELEACMGEGRLLDKSHEKNFELMVKTFIRIKLFMQVGATFFLGKTLFILQKHVISNLYIHYTTISLKKFAEIFTVYFPKSFENPTK